MAKTAKRREVSISYWTCNNKEHVPPNHRMMPDPDPWAFLGSLIIVPAWHETEAEAKACMQAENGEDNG